MQMLRAQSSDQPAVEIIACSVFAGNRVQALAFHGMPGLVFDIFLFTYGFQLNCCFNLATIVASPNLFRPDARRSPAQPGPRIIIAFNHRHYRPPGNGNVARL